MTTMLPFFLWCVGGFACCFYVIHWLIEVLIPYDALGYTKEDYVGKVINYIHDVIVVCWVYRLWKYGGLFDALLNANAKGSVFVYTHDGRVDALAAFTLAYVLVDLWYVIAVEGIEHQRAYVLFHSMIVISFGLYLYQGTGGVAVAVAMFTEIASIFEHNQTWIDSALTILFRSMIRSDWARMVAYRISQFHLIACFIAFLLTRTLITTVLWFVMIYWDRPFLSDSPIILLQSFMMTTAASMNLYFGLIRYHEFMRDVATYQTRILQLYARVYS